MLKKKFRIQPKQTLKIRDALRIHPLGKKEGGSNADEYFLLIKNNLTTLEKYPISFKKIPTQLALFSGQDKKMDSFTVLPVQLKNHTRVESESVFFKYNFRLKSLNNEPHFLSGVTIKSKKSLQKCLKLPPILPKYVLNSVEINIYLVPCSKMMVDFEATLILTMLDSTLEY